MSELTKEWLQQTIAELEEERDATPGAVNEDVTMALAAMKLALASLEAEPVAVTDDMAYAFHHALSDSSLGADEVEEIKAGLRAAFANVTATPAPVAPGAWEQWIADVVEYLEGGLEADGELEAEGSSEAKRLLSRRAAMLQGDEPVTTAYKLPEGWVAVPVEPTEEMIAAAMCSNDVLFDKEDDTLFRVQHGEIWRAMLSAAPQQEVK
ncbi:hypothetical protein ACS6O4_25240 [Enterobacter hormaechei subsp. steigerwaltii]|uniref:hypothetical protein n=1 Tax=Enterobacter hormaechei TaxID=158836 RepID=UPI003F424F84